MHSKTINNTKGKDHEFNDKEDIKCITVRLEISPQACDHSNKVVTKQSST